MQSSAAVGIRAFVMLACAVGIPVLAMSGASWPEILKKFQNFHCPTILDPASASTPSVPNEAPRFAPHGQAVGPQTLQAASPGLPATAVGSDMALIGDIILQEDTPALSARPADATSTANVSSGFREVQDRLQKMGATYYVLESWGNGQQLYRFYCKMAVGGNADYTHCFEATDAEPLQAMQQVLRQVETWQGGMRGTEEVAGKTASIL